MDNEFDKIPHAAVPTIFAAKLAYDVCGPSAKYLGERIASYAKVGVENLENVLKLAVQRLIVNGKTSGQVPPRVLKNILEEAYYCEDPVEALYLGGVLASSKCPIARDDRAIAYSTLIASLSSYQLRTHYLLYSSILRCEKPSFDQISRWIFHSTGVSVLLSEEAYKAAMEFSEDESPSVIAQHSFVGLQQKGLAEGGINVINPHPRIGRQPEESFRCLYPTISGIELFLWGLGLGEHGAERYDRSIFTDDLPPTIVPLRIELGRVGYG